MPRIARLLPCLLLLAAPFAAAAVPRSIVGFTMEMTRIEANAAFEQRGVTIMSESYGIVATTSNDPRVEYERYSFVAAQTDRPSQLWQVTIAYRMPYDHKTFDAVEDSLRARLGAPDQQAVSGADTLAGFEHRAWSDGRTAVSLTAQPNQSQDDESERMLVVWTDRRLAPLARAQMRPAGKPKHH